MSKNRVNKWHNGSQGIFSFNLSFWNQTRESHFLPYFFSYFLFRTKQGKETRFLHSFPLKRFLFPSTNSKQNICSSTIHRVIIHYSVVREHHHMVVWTTPESHIYVEGFHENLALFVWGRSPINFLYLPLSIYYSKKTSLKIQTNTVFVTVN